MITIGNNNYIESQNIRVFPCAYRGYYQITGKEIVDGVEKDKIETLVFDPEARATTEANFTNTFHKLSDNKDSYIVAWVPDTGKRTHTLKCVIGGYYFEIYNQTMSDFFYTENLEDKPYYLCINTKPIALGTSMTDDVDARTTTVLSSFEKSTNYLDIKQGNTYVFTGLLISKTATGTASLAPFRVVDSGGGGYNWEINAAKFPITNLLDVGSGNYSLRMVEDDTASGANTTIASGNYSVALGLKTTAEGEASTALGNNTTASARGAFAAGNNTTASGEGAAALGSNTEAEANNQVVIGAYNEKDNNQAFIIANGTTTAKSNKFTVSYEGNVNALGTLETKGSIKATGDSHNDLELGTPAAGSSGSIKVYGETKDKTVFTVENTGNTTIAGTTNIAGNTEIIGNTEIAGATTITNETESNSISTGALKVAGGAGITKNLNVGGELSVATDKATMLGGSLTTSGGTELKRTLEVTGATTLGSTLAVTGATQLNNTLSITGNTTIAATTANDGASATNTLTIGSMVENISGALDIYGTESTKVFSVTNTGGTTIAGKVTSAATDKGDSKSTLTTKGYVDGLQATILGALYPIGSIYMQYIATAADKPDSCPLANIVPNSTWELIENGRFLRSVGNTDDDIGKTGGNADAVLIEHAHNYNFLTEEKKAYTRSSGGHSHTVTLHTSGTGSGVFTGFEGNSGSSPTERSFTTSMEGVHTHAVELPEIGSVTTAEAEGVTVSSNGKDANLPPYLNVYMWRRIS